MARPHTRFQRGGAKRLTQWIAPADQAFEAVSSGGAALIQSAPFESTETIIRHRGQCSVIPQTAGADVDIVGAVGVCIVSAEAFAAGVASVPEPFNDADWGGWMVWRSFAFRQEFSDATGILNQERTFEIDSKAMRKISPNEVLVTVAESQVGAFSIATPWRVLVKLS